MSPSHPPPLNQWHTVRRRFFWRFGVLMGLMMLIAVCAGTFLFLLFATYQGWVDPSLWRPNWTQMPMPPSQSPFQRGRFSPLAGICWSAGLILFVVIAIRIVRRIALPISDLIVAAQRVQDGDYGVRVNLRGPREVRELGRAFNAMTTHLQSNTEQRRAMLADISHELRTPLAVIQGNVEGLIDGIYPRDDAHLQSILDETKVMSRLIEDLRTLAMTEAGNLVLQREPTDLAELAADVAASFQPQAQRLGIQLAQITQPSPDRSHEAGAPYVVNVDPVRIREVVTNLVSNALRYTPNGGKVTIYVESPAADNAAQSVHIRVQDTGRGIAPELLAHVFDRFTKSRDSMGSGLGLAIAKQLVEAHGGRIYAHSQVDIGTTVAFEI